MDGVIALAGCEDTLQIGGLFEVDPESAHGVVHSGKNLHRDFVRIVADELLVDLKNAFELTVERGPINMRQIKVDHRLPVDAEAMLIHHFMYGARGNIARNEV